MGAGGGGREGGGMRPIMWGGELPPTGLRPDQISKEGGEKRVEEEGYRLQALLTNSKGDDYRQGRRTADVIQHIARAAGGAGGEGGCSRILGWGV